MTDTDCSTSSATPPAQNGVEAERGEHVVRPEGEALKQAQQKLMQAMAAEDDPARGRGGLEGEG